jgi:hypothetical protein
MTAAACHSVIAIIDRVSVPLGGNEQVRQYQCDCTLTPCARRLESGLEPFKICLIGHNADALPGAPRIAPPGVPDSRAIAAAKSP